ncbi:MAG: thiamine pyrophosphate-dependent enzyme [Schleiferiaceae bacterium]|nr:thiamine pyrophosphate-dependent enzyme [Schleiferiaceae bacterium]MDR9441459.1 thiamine pyrophosphate-dependent enzyme [Schleiferiaceae bacterium]
MADAPDTSTPSIDIKTLEKAFRLMCEAKAMAALYEAHKKVTSKYVHATSRGHEAIQLACALQLRPEDFVAPYYRDDSILLGIGMEPYHCMLQLLAKRDDPFSGGRTYYSHPSLKEEDKPKIPHQSSATGMQAIPTTGVAMGVKLKEIHGLQEADQKPVVVCSIGDAAMTEGEISEALQMAGLKQLPIIYLVQDNDWDISANVAETRAQNAAEFAQGFHGIETRSIDGSQFEESYQTLQEVIAKVREERRPFLVHAKVPLLGHHTSGVRMEWYRDDLDEHHQRDPFPKMQALLRQNDFSQEQLEQVWENAQERVAQDFERATAQEDPKPEDLYKHDLAPTEVNEEKGEREPADKEKTVMVDAALFAIREILEDHPEALLYGQDVGGRLGGVFREAATLAQQFGDDRVFNTPIQEAFIIGSTVGMSAAGLKPIVEVQFADYIWPGLNQLFTEASRSYYLSNGKWPVHAVIRVPIGAYGSGGPYHSSSVESILTNIRGIKVAYPSTGADLKGLLKAAYYDPNPVVLLEHKGLYWSKIKGTEDAQTVEPSRDYILPLGKGRIAYKAEQTAVQEGRSLLVVTYGRGVYWAKEAASMIEEAVEILDLRSLAPLDEDLILERVSIHHKVLVVTEEPQDNGFAQSLAARIQQKAFKELDAPVQVLGSENMPAIPLNSTLEATMIPSAEKVAEALRTLARY